jgi:acetyl-CoA synthetase
MPTDIAKKITYQELFDEVCKLANVLKKYGVTKGDRVCIYMPMILESVIAMLACARIGAIHSVVFGGFSAQALSDRIQDASCKLVITTDGAFR